jgi:hypothetical protein
MNRAPYNRSVETQLPARFLALKRGTAEAIERAKSECDMTSELSECVTEVERILSAAEDYLAAGISDPTEFPESAELASGIGRLELLALQHRRTPEVELARIVREVFGTRQVANPGSHVGQGHA